MPARCWPILALGFIAAAGAAHACPAGPFPGFTAPSRSLDVAAADVGVVTAVHVKPGDVVVAGQLLAELDKRLLQAERRIAEARAEAGGELAAAEARMALAGERLGRIRRLQQRGAARADEVAEAEAGLDTATAERQQATENRAVAGLGLELIEARIARRYIVTPIDGVVTELHLDEAELAGGSDTTIATVHQLDPLHVEVYVPASCRAELLDGLAVAVEIAATGDLVPATLERIAVEVDEASGLVLATIALANPETLFLSGERVEVSLGGPG